jgi:hypothetical protein
MFRFLLPSLCVFTLCCALPARSQEAHLSEKGSSAIFSRSTFAHGYRHGYEEGYHLGNLDVNMGRLARVKKSQFGHLNLGYASGFGPKKSFEAGFYAGMRAGYGDGFAGRTFRAVDSMRAIAAALDESSPGVDGANDSFDRGLASGYRDGFEHVESSEGPSGALDFRNVGCARLSSDNQASNNQASDKEADLTAQGSYCDGYRRGFVLGHGDALVLGSAPSPLEASK